MKNSAMPKRMKAMSAQKPAAALDPMLMHQSTGIGGTHSHPPPVMAKAAAAVATEAATPRRVSKPALAAFSPSKGWSQLRLA